MFNDIRSGVTSGSDGLLMRAIQKREFKPYIQPIVCASNHKIIGGELLVRWHTSDRGVIYPDGFIDNMEKAGILSELTCSIINEVVVNFDGENKFNSEDFILHVNVAPSLLHNKKFISTCISAAKTNNLSLVLELTEQYFFTMDSKTISTFHCLKESGVQFALDDFGTGYS
ncbi:EAL domain-containing protein, partial [Escherichia coli]|nr:EAL domain-containing protein [Escherichia coli]